MLSKIKKLKNHKAVSLTIDHHKISLDFNIIFKFYLNQFWIYLNICDFIGFECEFTRKQDHAGIRFTFILFGYWIEFEWYDQRHWDYIRDCWENE